MSGHYSERKPKDFKPSDGDWVCAESGCGNVNFARRTNCNRCGTEKKEKKTKKLGQEIGSAAAEKSKGLFSAEDWQCTKCGNVNWARRSTCNVCNGPKFGEVEERTGLGGGFNERGVVEYKENQSDDDEYDVYGRLKKKKCGEKVTEVKKPVVSYEDDDEDDDDDDDEGDLSKYDLWGNDEDSKEAKSGTDSPEKNGKAKRKKSRSTSRSSSRSRSRSRDRKKIKSKRSRSRSSSGSSLSRSGSRSRRKSSRSRRSSSSSSSSRSSRGSSRRGSSRSKSRSRSRSRSKSKKSTKRSRRSSSSSTSESSRSRSRSRNRSRGKKR